MTTTSTPGSGKEESLISREELQQLLQTNSIAPEALQQLLLIQNYVSSILQKVFPQQIDLIIDQGSVGKGTAIPNSSDLDLLVYVHHSCKNYAEHAVQHQLESPHDCEVCFEDKTIKVWRDKFVEEVPRLVDDKKQESRPEFVQTVSIEAKGPTNLATMQFNSTLVVDVLFVPSIKSFRKPERFYDFSLRERWAYTYILGNFRSEYIKKQSEECKQLIRAVKVWKKRNAQNWTTNCNPPSYALELLVVHASTECKKTKPDATNEEVFVYLMKLLSNITEQAITFSDSYYDLEKSLKTKFETVKPLLLDPACPTYNLMYYFRLREPSKLMEYAKKTLAELSKQV